MPNDSSSSDPQVMTDIFQNDPYRKRSVTNHNKITWQVPSKSTPHSYLPYSDCSLQQQTQQQQQQKPLSSTARTDSLASNGFHSEQHEHSLSIPQRQTILDKDNIRQDSLLTTITTTARTSSTLVASSHPFLHSGATTLSLSEELRKQKYQDTKSCCHWPFLLLYPCCGHQGQRRKSSWRWICLMVFFFLVGMGGILLFICFPRLPLVTMAQTADTYGQELAEWGPPQNPFYRTTWQLNLTLDNRPNFIPLHITQMDLVLRLHPSSPLNISTSSSLPIPTNTNTNSTNTTKIITTPFSLTDDDDDDSINNNITRSTNHSSLHSITRSPAPPPPPPSSSISTLPVINQQQNGTFINNDNDATVPFAWSTLPPMILNTDGKHQVVNAIFHIDYVAPTSNLTDPTFAQLYKCGPHIITDPPALNVSLHITFHIRDYLWAPTLIVYPSEGNGLICPAN